MPHNQLTPFERALLRAVEELNETFEAGLKSASASQNELAEFASLRREFEYFATSLEKRLDDLQRQQEELRRILANG